MDNRKPAADVLLITSVIILAVTGQVLAKTGALVSGFNIFLAGSYAAFLCRGALWSWVLRHNPVSRVYPYVSLTYPLVLGSGILFFGESLTFGKAAGTVLIVAGSAVLASGGQE